MKFFGLIQSLLATQQIGIVGLITNHAFLDNPTFRGFRWNLLSQYSRIELLDLHGNSKKKEQVPVGVANENVFDIQQGVGISIMVRSGPRSGLAVVRLAEKWGSREEKYRALEDGRFDYRSIDCSAPWYKMSVQDAGLTTEYDSFVSLAEAMPLNSTGIKTHRDAFVIDFEEQPLRERVAKFRGDSSDAAVAEEFGLADTYGWKLDVARRRIRARADWQAAFQQCLYRPFDFRQIYYHGDLVELPRSDCMQHLAGGRNLALLATRQVTSPPYNHVLVTRLVSEMKTCSHDRGTNCFPLYLQEDAGLQFGGGKQLNFTAGFLGKLSQALKIAPAKQGCVPAGLTPEDILHYAYAVFHSPGYRSRYAELLKGDFPRLPLTESMELFRGLSRLGGDLTALHLFESPKLVQPITEFIGSRNPEVEKISWARDAVWIDKAQTTGFKGVREDVWNFHVGGYPVCEKWLKDRRGRLLSKADLIHYQRIVVALSETIRVMAEIDRVIDKHGGWPRAFSQNHPPPSATMLAAEQMGQKKTATASKQLVSIVSPKDANSLFDFDDDLDALAEAGGAPPRPKSRATPAKAAGGKTVVRAKLVVDITDAQAMCSIRRVLAGNSASGLSRQALMRASATELGFARMSPALKKLLDDAIRRAVRRGIAQNEGGLLSLLVSDIHGYDLDHLKAQLLAAIRAADGTCPRSDAPTLLARALGFARTVANITTTTESILRSLIRAKQVESKAGQIRVLRRQV